MTDGPDANRRRERIAWMFSTAVIAVLALRLPGSLAQRDDDYGFVRTLVDIHRQVTVNYVEPVEQDKLREAAIRGMLSVLDPFTVYIPPEDEKQFNADIEGSHEGVGIVLNQLPEGEIEVVTPIDGSPAFLAGVQAGDIILKVNGDSTAGKRLEEVISKIKGKSGSQVTLTVQHVTGDTADLSMERKEYVLPTVKGFDRNPDNTWNYWVTGAPGTETAERIRETPNRVRVSVQREPKIAYVRLTQFTSDTYKSLEPVLRDLVAQGLQGLVLDLRFNPGGRLDQATQIADLFLDKGIIVSTKGRNRPESIVTASGSGTLPRFPMAVIVNERSASASEILAGALSDNRRAVVVGSRSYGKGSVQEVIKLDGKSGELKMTVAYYYLPSGRLVHRKKDSTDWGVDPQVPVPMDETTEQEVWRARLDSENFRRPTTTRPAAITPPATAVPTQPTTQPTDTQLQQAVNTVTALILFTENKPATRP
jgi:carboxyl-terminal processing protease